MTTRIKDLIDIIKKNKDCIVYSPNGLPNIKNCNHKLPEDLIEFYENCGGIHLYCSSSYSISISKPDEFQLANPIIVGDMCLEDISSNWYIISNNENGQFITIDLSKNRLGKCYDSFWDTYAIYGETSIIANSFSDLLERLIKCNGDYWYWLKDDFKFIGDAYDSINN